MSSKIKGKKKKNNLVAGNDLKPEMTVNVTNDRLVKLMEAYGSENTAEKLNELISALVASRLLIPAMLNAEKKPEPCLISNNQGLHYLPVYTDKKQIPDNMKADGIMNMPYLSANETAVAQNNVLHGIVINPFTHNLILQMPLLERIKEVERQKAAAAAAPESKPQTQEEAQPKEVKLTEEQYVQFERRQFEAAFLPRKLFSEGEHFINDLIERKETCIDQLYEESYQEKRMYPYLEEDFSVMILDIAKDLMVIRVDMPERDMAPGLAYRVYLIWNPQERKAAYYRIAKGNKGHRVLEEVTPDIRIKRRGSAPQEGVELQEIIDRVNGRESDREEEEE